MTLFKHMGLLLLYLSPIFATFKGTCRPKSEVITTLENRYQIEFSELFINFNYDTASTYVKEYSETVAELKLLTANVTFSGKVKTKEIVSSDASSISFNTNLIAINRIKETINGKTRQSCKITYSENHDLGLDLPTEFEGAAIQLTEQCLQTHLCENFDSISVLNFRKKGKDGGEFDINTGLGTDFKRNDASKQVDLYKAETNSTSYNPQASINAATDFVINFLINNYVTDTNKTIQIPEIHHNFTTGKSFWLITGEIIMSPGIFKGLSKLERISDVIFENDNLRFSLALKFRLANVKIEFAHYKARYGKIKIDGKISGEIDEIILAAKMSVDYNDRPCRILLDEFTLEKLGNIDIDMTGLSILNGQVSYIISYLIRNNTFELVKEAAKKAMYSLNCETYRPRN